jgi:hypothetical protein
MGKPETKTPYPRLSNTFSPEDNKKIWLAYRDSFEKTVKASLQSDGPSSTIVHDFNYFVPFVMYESIERQEYIAADVRDSVKRQEDTAVQMREHVSSLQSVSAEMNQQLARLHKHSWMMIILTIVIAALTVVLAYYAFRLDSVIHLLPTTLPAR